MGWVGERSKFLSSFTYCCCILSTRPFSLSLLFLYDLHDKNRLDSKKSFIVQILFYCYLSLLRDLFVYISTVPSI